MMKKYLMMGIAALALASCSKDDITYINPDEAKYEMVFVNRFGTPNPNHTWGFGPSTRALTRGVFANGNEWAANDRDDCKYRVPPALTPDQIAVVKKYFQTVKDPEYQDPQWTNYFIQQVYKGGSAALTGTNPTYGEPYSPEQYTAANGTTQLVGSDYMDHLAAIDKTQNPEFVDHNNNFNHGDCGDGYPNVLDFKGTLTTVEETYPVNSGNEHRHKDKINLMTNSTTKSFGYYNSTGSVRRTEYTGLVSFQTIINELGDEANCLNDGWNRSFMGFDFEMMIGDELYAKNDDGTIKYLTYGDMPDAQYTWDGVSTYGGPRPAADEFVTDTYGNKIPVLNANTSMYAGTNGDIDQNQIITSHSCLSGYQYNQETGKNDKPYYQNQNCLNTKVLFDKVNNGYCLVDGSKGCKWVKIGGTADGYYSDWIVTLTEAKKYDTPDPDPVAYDYRVMAEDLSTNENSDFDFNDVVFDVKYVSSTTAKVKVRAAGGIYPIRIAGNDSYEIHALLGGGMTMLNTFKGHHYDLEADEIEVSGSFGSSAGSDEFKAGVRNIKIEVSKDGSKTWVELTAPTGKAASKIGVPVNVDWCDEYQDIDERWGTGAFAAWVANEQAPFWKGI